MKKNFIIIGFNYDTMKHSKALMPEFPTYWLVYPKKNEKTKELIPYGDDLIEKAKAANLDGLNLHYNTLTKGYVDKTHKAGLEMYVWTVDDPQIAIKLHNMGVDGITTNNRDLFVNCSRKIINGKKRRNAISWCGRACLQIILMSAARSHHLIWTC